MCNRVFMIHECVSRLTQLSIMIIYNIAWLILIQLIRVKIVMWQSDIVNTKLSVLPVCDKPYHTNKRKVQKRKLKCVHYADEIDKIDIPSCPHPGICVDKKVRNIICNTCVRLLLVLLPLTTVKTIIWRRSISLPTICL